MVVTPPYDEPYSSVDWRAACHICPPEKGNYDCAEQQALTIGIAGRLTPDGCDAVNQILNEGRNRHQQVKIDLSGVKLVDRPSVEYLANIRRHQIALINVPSYVRRWADQVSNEVE
jgi:ABC-type transporter Mla MlaB component